jgi:hypothetical protein
MNNPIRQMQLQFDPLQDRLLFRLNTFDKAEYRLWFTRRYTKLLWQALIHTLEKHYVTSAQFHDPHVKSAVLSFQHEQAVSQTDFNTHYYEDTYTYPLGETPVLVSRIALREQNDAHILCLHPESGSGIEFKLDQKTLHSFLKLISESVKKSEWDIVCTLPTASAPTHLN